MIDRRLVGTTLEPFTVDVERGRLRLFASTTGLDDPVYHDEAAAAAQGYPGLPVPPTYFFCLEMDGPNPAAIRQLLGLDYRRILHGEQGFRFHRMAFAGERLRFVQRIDDIYDKKGGALEFILRSTQVNNAQGERVCDMRTVTVYRNPTP